MDELIEFLENFDFAYDVRADYASFREEMGLTATTVTPWTVLLTPASPWPCLLP